ncbi:hypothetical protein SPAR65_0008 [Streptococcus pneumoniae GA40563]|nr:hypothetical protein SPAR65_0008 [Streptococcus pneumoniae GA40563]
MSVDIEAIRWLLDNATAYAISKNCGMSIQAVDKYKKWCVRYYEYASKTRYQHDNIRPGT